MLGTLIGINVILVIGVIMQIIEIVKPDQTTYNGIIGAYTKLKEPK